MLEYGIYCGSYPILIFPKSHSIRTVLIALKINPSTAMEGRPSLSILLVTSCILLNIDMHFVTYFFLLLYYTLRSFGSFISVLHFHWICIFLYYLEMRIFNIQAICTSDMLNIADAEKKKIDLDLTLFSSDLYSRATRFKHLLDTCSHLWHHWRPWNAHCSCSLLQSPWKDKEVAPCEFYLLFSIISILTCRLINVQWNLVKTKSGVTKFLM